MIGNFPAILNLNRLFSNSTGSFVIDYRLSPINATPSTSTLFVDANGHLACPIHAYIKEVMHV